MSKKRQQTKVQMKTMKYINSAKRAHNFLRSLLDSGYTLVSGSEVIGYYKLRHCNGTMFVVRLSADEVHVTKNNRQIRI